MGAPPQVFNFAAPLFEANRDRRERTAYIDDAASITFGELEHRARCLAAALAQMGVRREERVLILMHDTLDWPDLSTRALLTGEDLTRLTGLAPGKELGALKRALLEAQLRGEVTTREEAERFVTASR